MCQGRLCLTKYAEINIPTLQGIHMSDITPHIRNFIAESGVDEGVVTVVSRHTTASLTINELEGCLALNIVFLAINIPNHYFLTGRLVDDARQFLLKLVPAAYPYLHNDLHLRSGPPAWPGGDEAWRAQESVNVSLMLSAQISYQVSTYGDFHYRRTHI